ncbi:contractile injection system protein, VgrG/Pvc8 family [Sphingomonas sp.]|uniref:contractile injection system protein, VgrG/Pvc8 family n=1 Tax=Sphingomonas sp. TaxID=28214 RepID=UPI002EDA9A77
MSANIPDFRLTLGGQDLRGAIFNAAAELLDITAKVRPRLISLTLTEKRGDEADQLEITLDDADGKLEMPKAGAVLKLQLGWAQGRDVTPGLVDKGSFKVDEVEHSGPPDQVRITARSADFTSELKARREKSWHDTTLGAIVNEIAGRNGLQGRCAAALASIQLKSFVQSRESDMALMRRLGREHDAVATIKGGSLILVPIGQGETATGKPLAEVTLRRRDGDRHSYRLAKRDDSTGATASWHDRKAAKKKQVTVGKADGAKKLSRTYASEAQARAAAKAASGRAARQAATFDYSLAFGRADLMPEQKVVVRGFKSEIDAVPWRISEVAHSLSDRGFTTSIKLERA